MAEKWHSGITMHKLSFGSGFIGLLFAGGSALIFVLALLLFGPKKLPELIGLSCGVMIVAAEATGKAPPTVRVSALTALAADSVQTTVVSPAGDEATVGESEIRAGSDRVCAVPHVPTGERVCARTIVGTAYVEQRNPQLTVVYCIQTIVTVPSSATASCGRPDSFGVRVDECDTSPSQLPFASCVFDWTFRLAVPFAGSVSTDQAIVATPPTGLIANVSARRIWFEGLTAGVRSTTGPHIPVAATNLRVCTISSVVLTHPTWTFPARSTPTTGKLRLVPEVTRIAGAPNDPPGARRETTIR